MRQRTEAERPSAERILGRSLEIEHSSGKLGGLNGSTQHQIETQAEGFQQLRVVRER